MERSFAKNWRGSLPYPQNPFAAPAYQNYDTMGEGHIFQDGIGLFYA